MECDGNSSMQTERYGLTNCHEVLADKCFYIAILVMRYGIVGEQSYWYSGLVINIKLEFEMKVMIQKNGNKRVMMLVLRFNMVALK